MEVRKTTNDGKVLKIATHGPGEFIGEFSVIDEAPRTADIVALENTECLVLTAWEFKALMKAHPEIALSILPIIVKRFRETNAELIALKNNN